MSSRLDKGTIKPVNLRILDKDYVIACPENECETLSASARYLTQKIQEVKEGGKIVSIERLVVVSALNIIHEYMQYKQQREQDIHTLEQHIEQLQAKIELALTRIKQ
jgi:cell division protein ZapA